MKSSLLRIELKGTQLYLAAFMLSMANMMVVLDMTITNVSIPHITGGLAVASNQGTWVITSYAVAEAICIPLTGWLVQRFGGVRVFIGCLIGFTVFSFLCGLSNSLLMLVLCRIGQGVFGGPLMPVTQTLLMQIFPKEKQQHAIGIWAMTIVLGPILGPVIGGVISDQWSWNWIFFINIPVGVACALGVYYLLKQAMQSITRVKVDFVGLFLLVCWIGALQLILDFGHDLDWFSSTPIILLSAIAILSFIFFIAWEITHLNPVVDLRIFRNYSFSVSAVVLAIAFGSFFGSIVLMPQWLQTNLGYTATWAGLVTATMGFGSLLMSAVVARYTAGIDQRLLACIGLSGLAVSSLMRALWNNQASFMDLAWPQIIQGFSVPFFFIPLTNLAMARISSEDYPSATGLMNFLRTMAGAVGASIAITLWDRYGRVARSELVANVNADESYNALIATGNSQDTALDMISTLVNHEAMTLSINQVFLIISFMLLLAAGLLWFCPKTYGNAAM